MIAAGLISGTSFDGIDAALIEIVPIGATYTIELRRFATFAYEPALHARLERALPPHLPDVREVVALDGLVGAAFAAAAAAIAEGVALDYVASHGQTIYHAGAQSQTLQIGNAFLIREGVGATVISDFRSADCAAGGHGAPLVPYVDALFFADAHEDRVVLNIGGIANLTVVPRGAQPRDVLAFDTGPGNMLIDALVAQRTAGRERFDRNGAYARAGAVDAALLRALLDDPYFALAPPKSTGREKFGVAFLERFRAAIDRASLADASATLTQLSVESIAAAIERYAAARGRLIVSGGGVENHSLMRLLAARLPAYVVERSDATLAADAKEAIAFAVLGYETLRGRPAALPRVTGARHAALLGAIAPHNLHALLAKIAAELARSPER